MQKRLSFLFSIPYCKTIIIKNSDFLIQSECDSRWFYIIYLFLRNRNNFVWKKLLPLHLLFIWYCFVQMFYWKLLIVGPNNIFGWQPQPKIFLINRYSITGGDSGSFITKAATLWNSTSERFKNTELLPVAKSEAIKISLSLPV